MSSCPPQFIGFPLAFYRFSYTTRTGQSRVSIAGDLLIWHRVAQVWVLLKDRPFVTPDDARGGARRFSECGSVSAPPVPMCGTGCSKPGQCRFDERGAGRVFLFVIVSGPAGPSRHTSLDEFKASNRTSPDVGF